jgi:hypothetical protein
MLKVTQTRMVIDEIKRYISNAITAKSGFST